MNIASPLLWLMLAVLVIVAAGLLWIARMRQQRGRAEAARREAETLERARAQQAEHAARAAQAAREAQQRQQAKALARETAAAERRAAEALQAEREQAEREELARQAAELRAARDAAAAAKAARAATAAQEAAREAARAAAAATRVLRADETLVLVADDSKIVRVKLGRLLAAQGYRVAQAENGEEALAAIAAERPHVLITDVEMPGIDGFELTRRVRAAAATAALPVLMITSSDDKRAEAEAAGVTQLLGKPYPEETLIAAIEQARLAVRVPA